MCVLCAGRIVTGKARTSAMVSNAYNCHWLVLSRTAALQRQQCQTHNSTLVAAYAEVMDNTLRAMRSVPGQTVFRARFSAITAPDIKAAMVSSQLLQRDHR